MVILVFFDILQLPHTVISNSEKLTHPIVQCTLFEDSVVIGSCRQVPPTPLYCMNSRLGHFGKSQKLHSRATAKKFANLRKTGKNAKKLVEIVIKFFLTK